MDRSRRKWESELVQSLYGEGYVGQAAIRESPKDYVLCFSLFEMLHLLDGKPKGGSYVYSACEAFN